MRLDRDPSSPSQDDECLSQRDLADAERLCDVVLRYACSCRAARRPTMRSRTYLTARSPLLGRDSLDEVADVFGPSSGVSAREKESINYTVVAVDAHFLAEVEVQEFEGRRSHPRRHSRQVAEVLREDLTRPASCQESKRSCVTRVLS